MKTMNEFINELKDNGFSVYTSDTKEKPNYISFVKDDKIGYCQIDNFGHWSFSTVHKPCREAGTGFNVVNELAEPIIQHALNCLVVAPGWAINRKKFGVNAVNSPIKKYKNWEEYVNTPLNQIMKYKQL